jgi:hypothetical protein
MNVSYAPFARTGAARSGQKANVGTKSLRESLSYRFCPNVRLGDHHHCIAQRARGGENTEGEAK